MANELNINSSIQYDDGDVADSLDQSDLSVTLTTLKFTKVVQSIGTSDEAIQLGEVTSPGYIFVKNLDTTNYIELKNAVSGTKFCKVAPGCCAGPFQFSSNVTAPAAIANTAACKCVFLIASN